MTDKVLCTLCARGGSKGVKNKNTRSIAGIPLIAHSIRQAQATGLFEHIVVSTDSDAISETAQAFGAEVFFKRPAELATDRAAKLPVIQHAFRESEKHFGEQYDILVDLDPTSPLRLPEDIIGACELLREKHWDNVITAAPARRSPYFNMVTCSEDGVTGLVNAAGQVFRRQDAPACYDMNASVYVWWRNTLLDSNNVFLKRTGLYVMPEERSIDIDSELDFRIVKMLLEERENAES